MQKKVDVHSLYKQIGRMEFDVQTLKAALHDYAQPKKKIHELIKNKEIFRLFRGFYIFSPEKVSEPYSPEVIANLMYGPSYISMESALAHYSLIPERVAEVICVTLKRSKRIKTPVGRFEYRHLNKEKYSVGITLQPLGDSYFLIASPEKALVDILYFRAKNLKFKTSKQINNYLARDLRIDLADLKLRVNPNSLQILRKIYYRNDSIRAFLDYLTEGLT